MDNRPASHHDLPAGARRYVGGNRGIATRSASRRRSERTMRHRGAPRASCGPQAAPQPACSPDVRSAALDRRLLRRRRHPVGLDLRCGTRRARGTARRSRAWVAHSVPRRDRSERTEALGEVFPSGWLAAYAPRKVGSSEHRSVGTRFVGHRRIGSDAVCGPEGLDPQRDVGVVEQAAVAVEKGLALTPRQRRRRVGRESGRRHAPPRGQGQPSWDRPRPGGD